MTRGNWVDMYVRCKETRAGVGKGEEALDIQVVHGTFSRIQTDIQL